MKSVLGLVLLLLFVPPAMAEALSPAAMADIELSRTLINDKRNTALAFNMTFTDAEREAFWPLYQKYREAMSNVASRKLEMIIDYAENFEEMTEDKAADLLRRAMLYEEQALEVKHHYMDQFLEILPPTKVARLYQIENRMDTAIAMKLSEGIPLIE